MNYEFKAGEIIFITGGNGSGKSTLAKLITGLYKYDEREILINGNKIEYSKLGNYYAAVFNDFYLLKKLYRIN
ncbi:ATP-binding cassette domain-containing protein [Clostridium estertheticum]|nr:ATP-binding cassette domain-containing protein [Clostridium estertheticum]